MSRPRGRAKSNRRIGRELDAVLSSFPAAQRAERLVTFLLELKREEEVNFAELYIAARLTMESRVSFTQMVERARLGRE